jgi:hypothetical protein
VVVTEAVAIFSTVQITDTVEPVDPAAGHQDTVMVTAAVMVQVLVVKDLMVAPAVDSIIVVVAVAPAVLVQADLLKQMVVQEYITTLQEQAIIGPVAVAAVHTVLVQAAMVALVEEVVVLSVLLPAELE